MSKEETNATNSAADDSELDAHCHSSKNETDKNTRSCANAALYK